MTKSRSFTCHVGPSAGRAQTGAAARVFWPGRERMVRYRGRREHRVPTGPAPD